MIPVVWLASYPRSGNTMLRIILAQCFGLPSAAIYGETLDGNDTLKQLTGSLTASAAGVFDFGNVPVRILKTHGRPQDGSKAIYVMRNGVDATASFHDHGKRQVPIGTLIHGRPGLPTWSEHVNWWMPRERPDTLLLRYEDVIADMGSSIDRIAAFIGIAPSCHAIPSRDELAAVDGRWVRSATAANRTRLTPDQVAAFWRVNGAVMREYGYDSPDCRQPGTMTMPVVTSPAPFHTMPPPPH